jgi:hypothetical protein
MPEYVKREAATQAAVRAVWLGQTSAGQIAKAINDVPAADVMEVTRCKDCEHSHRDQVGLFCTNFHSACNDCLVPEYYFCFHGEPRRNG